MSNLLVRYPCEPPSSEKHVVTSSILGATSSVLTRIYDMGHLLMRNSSGLRAATRDAVHRRKKAMRLGYLIVPIVSPESDILEA